MMNAKSQQFLNDLALFYRNKGQQGVTSQHLTARINGKPVDLWELYSYVLEFGGSFKVNQANLWDEIYAKIFGKKPVGANVSVALRQIYQRYLMPYEKVNCSNFSNEVLDDEEEEKYKQDSSNFVLHSSFSYSHQTPHQQNTTFFENPLNKLFCSLLSGLKNEIDFGLRITTVLTNSKESDWISDFKFIDVLLECCDSYACCCDDIPKESKQAQEKHDGIEDEIERITKPKVLVKDRYCDCSRKFWSEICEEKSVLYLVFGENSEQIDWHLPQDYQKIYNLVKYIAEIIRNLSFNLNEQISNQQETDEWCQGIYLNCATLNLLKFLILLMSCKDQYLNNIGFDILSNISPITASEECEQYNLILTAINKLCVDHVVSSNDLNRLSRCLEVMSKVINTDNEDVSLFLSSKFLTDSLRQRLIEFLTCQHDVSLVTSALECCRALSENYPRFLSTDCNYLIKILLTLLNCEASIHFTKSALNKVKVIDERPKVEQAKVSTVKPPIVNQVNNSDIEVFIINWLRSAYEARPSLGPKNNALRIGEIYEEYLKHCIRAAKKNAVTVQSFGLLIKKCFPSVNIINGTHVEGLSVKVSTKNMTSPILKAHLSAPPKGSPIINPPTTSTSTLIKNLLANKLRVSSNTVSSPSVLDTKTSNVPVTLKTTIANASNFPTIKTETSVASCPTITTSVLPTANVFSNPNTNAIVNSTISTGSNVNNNIIVGSMQPQQPQQFLLVRTIIGNQPQQSLVGVPGGTPVRLLLPSNFLTQRAPTPSNGIPVSNASFVPTTSSNLPTIPLSPSNTSSSSSSSSNDILLKAVLRSGIVSEPPPSPTTPTRTNAVKSSPLLNVLLDKGKLPDFSTIAGSTQVSSAATSTGSSSPVSSAAQGTKMFILTTKTPMAKSTSQPICSVSSSQGSEVTVTPVTYPVVDKESLSNGEVPMEPAAVAANSIGSDLSSITDICKTVDDATKLMKRPNDDEFLSAKKARTLNTTMTINSICNSGFDSSSSPPRTNTETTITPVTMPVKSSLMETPTIQASMEVEMKGDNHSKMDLTDGKETRDTSMVVTRANVPTIHASNTSGVSDGPITSKMRPETSMIVERADSAKTSVIISNKSIADGDIKNSGLGVTKSVIVESSSASAKPFIDRSVCVSVDGPVATKSRPESIVTKSNSMIAIKSNPIDVAVKSRPVPVIATKSSPMVNIDEAILRVKNMPLLEVSTAPPVSERLSTHQENRFAESSSKVSIEVSNVSKPEEKRLIITPENERIKIKSSVAENSIYKITGDKLEIKENESGEVTISNKVSINKVDKQPVSKEIIGDSFGENKNSLGKSEPEPSIKTKGDDKFHEKIKLPKDISCENSIEISKDNSISGHANDGTCKTNQPKVTPPKPEYTCEWDGCKRTFSRASQVYWHVHKEHVNIYSDSKIEMSCHWGGPEGQGPGCQSTRPLLSLLTHLHDFHCNPQALEQAAIRNKDGNTGTVTVTTTSVPPAHPGYAHNAALLAIRRHAINYVEPLKPAPVNSYTPLSVSIRITAALILRNLAHYSSVIKRILLGYEPYLSELCIIEGRDESRTLAQCLAVIIDKNEFEG